MNMGTTITVGITTSLWNFKTSMEKELRPQNESHDRFNPNKSHDIFNLMIFSISHVQVKMFQSQAHDIMDTFSCDLAIAVHNEK